MTAPWFHGASSYPYQYRAWRSENFSSSLVSVSSFCFAKCLVCLNTINRLVDVVVGIVCIPVPIRPSLDEKDFGRDAFTGSLW